MKTTLSSHTFQEQILWKEGENMGNNNSQNNRKNSNPQTPKPAKNGQTEFSRELTGTPANNKSLTQTTKGAKTNPSNGRSEFSQELTGTPNNNRNSSTQTPNASKNAHSNRKEEFSRELTDIINKNLKQNGTSLKQPNKNKK